MKYTQGVCEDGAAILCDGQQITIDAIVTRLNSGDAWLNAKESPHHQQLIEINETAPFDTFCVYPNTDPSSGEVEWYCDNSACIGVEGQIVFIGATEAEAVQLAYDSEAVRNVMASPA